MQKGSCPNDQGNVGQKIWTSVACSRGRGIRVRDHPRSQEFTVYVFRRHPSYSFMEMRINFFFFIKFLSFFSIFCNTYNKIILVFFCFNYLL